VRAGRSIRARDLIAVLTAVVEEINEMASRDPVGGAMTLPEPTAKD